MCGEIADKVREKLKIGAKPVFASSEDDTENGEKPVVEIDENKK